MAKWTYFTYTFWWHVFGIDLLMSGTLAGSIKVARALMQNEEKEDL